jgi:hypothetical protein
VLLQVMRGLFDLLQTNISQSRENCTCRRAPSSRCPASTAS